MNLGTLAQTGTYSVTVNPDGQATMGAALSLPPDVTGTLTLNSSTTVSLTSPGQQGEFTFVATANEAVILSASSFATTPANTPVTFYVYNASGALVNQVSLSADGTLNVGTLGAGTYTVVVAPNNAATGSVSIDMQPAQTTAVPTNGSPTNIVTAVPGENASATFQATAGDSISTTLTNLAFSSGSSSSVSWTITAPDKSVISAAQTCQIGAATGCNSEQMILPQTGTYTISIVPSGSQTFSVTVSVAENVNQVLSPGTAQTLSFSSQTGDAARFTFTVASGQALTASLSSLSYSPSSVNIWMGVYKTDGSYVTGNETTSGEILNLSGLAPGTYYLWIGALGFVNGSMQLSFEPQVTSIIPTDGSSNYIRTNGPGQSAYFKFSANAGDSVTLTLTSVSLSPSSPNYVNWNVAAPDGTVLGAPPACNSSDSSCPGEMMTLPQTGTYTVTLAPPGLQTFSAAAIAAENLTGVLTSGETQTINISPQTGTAARFTFTINSGQSFTANLSGITTTPSNVQIWMGAYRLDGSYVTGNTTTTGESLPLNMSAGTYYLWIGALSGVTSGTMRLSFQ
jgi:hypothetical protein